MEVFTFILDSNVDTDDSLWTAPMRVRIPATSIGFYEKQVLITFTIGQIDKVRSHFFPLRPKGWFFRANLKPPLYWAVCPNSRRYARGVSFDIEDLSPELLKRLHPLRLLRALEGRGR